jgi:hypothetical protein
VSVDRAGLHRPIRPRAGRVVAYAVAVAWALLTLALATGFPARVPGAGLADSVGFAVIGVAGVVLLLRLGGVAVLPSEAGIEVRNVVGRRTLDWAEVVDVRFGPHSTWGRLNLSDGTSLQMMGIQSADGGRAAQDAVRLATLVELHAREQGPQGPTAGGAPQA